MDHDAADDLALDFVEGTLSPALEPAFRAHVATCALCRENLDRLEQAQLLSTTAARELRAERTGCPPRATIDAQVLSAASRAASSRRSGESQRRRRRNLAVATLAAAIAALAWFAVAW